MTEFLSKFKQVESFKLNYNEEQLAFIQSKIENSCLLGIPGGGKTASIIGKILYHFNIGHIKKNNEFLIASFSRRACHDFITKGQKQHKKLFNSRNICTLHSIAGKIMHKLTEKKSSSQDTVIIAASEIIFQKKDECLNMTEFKSLKVIFVDEAQDISEIQYQLIQNISKITQCAIIMVGDPNQNIYQFQNGCDRFLMEHSTNKYHLIKNYRSSKQIVDFVNQFKPWELLTQNMISTKKKDHNKPTLFCGSIPEIIDNIVNKIKNSNYKRENIAIIGPVKKSKPMNDYYSNIGLSLMTNLLEDYDIPYLKHYEDTNNTDVVLDKFKKQEGYINLMTIHGSKGLEFDEVFVLNFHVTTFGIMPNEQKYNEFKYLWYVALSRACYDMHIYVDHHRNKHAWFELKNCPLKYYKIENKPPNMLSKLNFKEEIKPVHYSVTELLNHKKFFDDKHFYVFEKLIQYDIEEEDLFENFSEYTLFEHDQYSALYGMFVENIFNYYYQIKNNKIPDFISKLKNIIENSIIVPKNMIGGYKILKMKCPFIVKDLVKLRNFDGIKKTFKKREQELYNYLIEILGNDYHQEFFLDCYNDVAHYSKDFLLTLIKKTLNEKNKYNEEEIHYCIFQMTLYYYQMSNETAYLWKKDFHPHLNHLSYIINKIKEYVKDLNDDFIFHPIFKHLKLPIVGELDILTQDSIIDIKLTKQLNKKQIIQMILYHNLLSPDFEKMYHLELWNFYVGKKFKIILQKDHFMNYELLKLLSVVIQEKLKNMIFIYDLETTGLIQNNNYVDIIDRHFEEYETSCIPSTGLVKPQKEKIIPYEIMQLTGISNEQLLINGDDFQKFSQEIDNIFSYCEEPIFIAHNGFSFDHKIMIEKNLIDKNKAKFLDSRMIIRLFLEKDIASKSLSQIFEHLFGFSPVAHRANNDVHMLIMIMKKLNINASKIMNIQY